MPDATPGGSRTESAKIRGWCVKGHGKERERMMEAVVERGNMMAALRHVDGNRGSAGVDGMEVDVLRPYLREQWPRIKEELLDGRYKPGPVKRVEIPKPGGRWGASIGHPNLEKFFDRSNHDVLMPRVARKAEDKRVLGLIRRYLQAGVMAGGVVSLRTEKMPQGGTAIPASVQHLPK